MSPSSSAPPGPLIRLEGVSRVYGASVELRPALHDVTLDVASGEFVAVVGPSGSGKSTLLNLLGGLDRPTTGTVRVGDLDLGKASEAALDLHRRTCVGFVFQSFHLNPRRTALDNVAIPLLFSGVERNEARKAALACLEQVGLADLAVRPVSTLSGGQRQRVAIARAFVHAPSLLLADEPVGQLDASTGGAVVELLARLHDERGVTVVAVSHDRMVLEAASRTIRLLEGRLVSDGDALAQVEDVRLHIPQPAPARSRESDR